MKHLRFRRIVGQHKDRIYTQAYYFLGSHDEAEDVTQEVLLKIWERIDEFPREHTTAWIMKVTRNRCIDHVRRRQKTVRLSDVEDGEESPEDRLEAVSDPEAEAEQSEMQRRVEREIRKLPEPLRNVILLREIQGLKYEEVARAMNIPLNSVKVYLYRGRRILREKLSFLLE
ncbi:MAG: sigma-70 family RNA polymerase sigma factor [Candidatus Latescibacteria bacterium]|nr:sigma-70 family RNA polymerase sigma factor [Candidatus Latescibacterota bacterium]